MSGVSAWYGFLRAYCRTRLGHHGDETGLRAHQARLLRRQLRRIGALSPHYRRYAGRPLEAWPVMDKAGMLAHFDEINTAGLRLSDVWAVALAAESRRDFAPTLDGYTVGMSSGTSGRRGVFVVSAREQAEWAGTVLARFVLRGLRRGQRVALFLRADSNLYHCVGLGGIRFRFFDLFQPFSGQVARLQAWQPDIVVAPPQVLLQIGLATRAGRVALRARAISVAEVLEPAERALLATQFGQLGEIYQASEGFLGMRCAHGNLHLNEEDLLIERDWLDGTRTRFVPVVTDLRRTLQPIIRYRLDDVLRMSGARCPCGRAALVVDAVEGRCDDQLLLPDEAGGVVTVFSDLVSRALAQVLPPEADYRLQQLGSRQLVLCADLEPDRLEAVRAHLVRLLAQQRVATGRVHWRLESKMPALDSGQKRRRICRMDAGPEDGP